MGSGPTMTLDNVVSSSELSFMPDDDLHSMSVFDTVKSRDDVDVDMADSEHISKEGTTDTFLNALADFHSLSGHLNHIYDEVSNIHSRIADMESFILQSVSDEIKNSMPTLISNALQDQLPGLLTDTLKACLPSILKDSLPTQLHKAVVRPMNKQFNIYHTTESEHFVTLQKALTKVLKFEMGQSVTSKGLFESTVIIDDTIEGEKNKKDKDANLAATHEEQQLADKIHSSGLIFESRGEQPAKLEVANKDSTPQDNKTNKGKIQNHDSDIQDPIPLNSFVLEHVLKPKEQKKEPTPPRDSAKGKEVAIVEEQVNELVSYQEEGGYIPRMPKIKSFITLEETLSQEEFNNQIKKMKRSADLKAEKEKSEQELRKMFNQATLKAQA
ncbi:hypothetical protein Tco_0240642 [Tanacetum coccineum]